MRLSSRVRLRNWQRQCEPNRAALFSLHSPISHSPDSPTPSGRTQGAAFCFSFALCAGPVNSPEPNCGGNALASPAKVAENSVLGRRQISSGVFSRAAVHYRDPVSCARCLRRPMRDMHKCCADFLLNGLQLILHPSAQLQNKGPERIVEQQARPQALLRAARAAAPFEQIVPFQRDAAAN